MEGFRLEVGVEAVSLPAKTSTIHDPTRDGTRVVLPSQNAATVRHHAMGTVVVVDKAGHTLAITTDLYTLPARLGTDTNGETHDLRIVIHLDEAIRVPHLCHHRDQGIKAQKGTAHVTRG